MSEPICIQAAHAFKLNIPLKTEFAVAYASYDRVETIVASVGADNGVVGWGSASPDEEVTGETVESTFKALTEKIGPALMEAQSAPPARLLRVVFNAAPEAPAARAAADIAIHDLWSKSIGCSLSSLLGAYRTTIPTSVTIGICDESETLERARAFIDRGFSILKIKCGKNADEDIARVKKLRETIGEKVKLRLDANQGYSLGDARKAAAALAPENIEFIEQPTAAKDRETLVALASESPIPVMADESALDAKDALELFQAGVPLVNIKLMKCGGVREALRICDIALTLGKKVMIGCMDELPLSMAAAAAVALAHPAVAYADLDGHIDLEQRVAAGGIIIDNGFVSVTERPGLGVEIRKQYLKE